jgi:hypothetical protein
MNRIHRLFDALIGLRKLFFSIGALVFIAITFTVVLGVFIINWHLGTTVISGDNFTDIITAGFRHCSTIVAAYLAINVANKYVQQHLKRKHK